MSPRSAEQNEVLRAETRARIMDAALKLFSLHGYERTSVRMLAEESGVAQGLMYSYFNGKDALLQALFRKSMEEVQQSFASADNVREPTERLRQYILGIGPMIRKHQKFWRLSYGVRMQQSVLNALGDAVGGWTRAVRKTLETYLADAGVDDAEVQARVLFAVVDGVCQHFVLEPRRYPLEPVLQSVVQRFVPPAPKRKK